ncbi:MAG: sulfatase-like hydrolase/transferase [Acidobacteriota bacterium]
MRVAWLQNRRLSQFLGLGCLVLALLMGWGCGRPSASSRGIILISVDTLRADHLGCYGYERDTSPFIDQLAQGGVLFENAYVQLPGTLPSHMSIFTGLYPAEHNVYPPDGLLSDQIPTLPEVFLANGFRTAGHTEGGYMDGGFGFARGFEEFNDHSLEIETDLERTFARGLEFLQRRRSNERFFLFLHTYSVHDPYGDLRMEFAHFPPAYGNLYWSGSPPEGAVLPTGPLLTEINRLGVPPSEEVREYYRATYDAQIRYLDDVLRGFFEGLEALGLLDEVTVVLTSDHGEELGDHGKFLHDQIYRETLRVPLIVLHPSWPEGARVSELVQSIDLAPTLYELAGIDVTPSMSGVDLSPLVTRSSQEEVRESFVESLDAAVHRSIIRQTEEGLFQLMWSHELSSEEGEWISDEVVFDTFEDTFTAEIESFHRERRLEVLVDGQPYADVGLAIPKDKQGVWVASDVSFGRRDSEIEIELQSFHRERLVEVYAGSQKLAATIQRTPAAGLGGHGEWRSTASSGGALVGTDPVILRFVLGEDHPARVVTLRSENCDSPAMLGISGDPRCLAFQVLRVRGLEKARKLSDDLLVPPDPRTLLIELPRGGHKKRVTLRPTSCESPASLGLSDDERCLSLWLASPPLWRIELYDNDRDPAQQRDLSAERPELSKSMLRALHQYQLEPMAEALSRDLEPDVESRLRALGYLP